MPSFARGGSTTFDEVVFVEDEDEEVALEDEVGGGGNLRRRSVVGAVEAGERGGREMDTTGRATACFFSPNERVLCRRIPAPPWGTVVLRNRGLPPLPFVAAGPFKAAESKAAGPREVEDEEDCEDVEDGGTAEGVAEAEVEVVVEEG